MAGKRKQDDPLAALLETTPKAKLVDLLVRVAATRPAVRRECLDYLNLHTALSPSRWFASPCRYSLYSLSASNQ